ncbi:MAG: flagellar biosynthesis anti-sigma factor FlgM [Planctomycetota bacterium]|jgi:anti-sigma28 factor (negative regulator of flagellin synthesis)
MNQVNNVDSVYPQPPVQQRNAVVAEAPVRSLRSMPQDEVEISDAAVVLAQVDTARGRADRIARLRAEIANGTFETPERLDGTVERLLQELRP